ncbi:MAG: hypothetical protein ACM3PR_11010 [Bacteroidales bacterium]
MKAALKTGTNSIELVLFLYLHAELNQFLILFRYLSDTFLIPKVTERYQKSIRKVSEKGKVQGMAGK